MRRNTIFLKFSFKNSYQSFDSLSSVTTTEVSGQGYMPIEKRFISLDEIYENNVDLNQTYELIDSSDFLTSPNEFNSIFILTNFVRTEQIQG